jgi:hypothetical protein
VGIWWFSSIQFYDPRCPLQDGPDKWFTPANCTAQTRIDVFMFRTRHMYSPDYDPEGLLSTFTTAAITVCAGNSVFPPFMTTVLIIGTLLSKHLVPIHHKYCISPSSTIRTRLQFYITLFISSILLIHPLPHLFFPLLPFSKPLWTPPFVTQTIGISLLSWLFASVIDIYPFIPFTTPLQTMGRQSLEVYLAAEILQEFVMYPGKRNGGGMWEVIVGGIEKLGVRRDWSCLLISVVWAGIFTGFGCVFEWLGWKIRF